MVISKSYKTDNSIRKDIEPLFISAFPSDERPPADYFFSSFDKTNNHLYGFYDSGLFVGFSSVIIYKDICYIFFLAVKESQRNKGYGSQILKQIKDMYKDYVLLLCYEDVDPSYKDYENRKRREQFYMKNGFKRIRLKLTNLAWYFKPRLKEIEQ